MTRLLIINFRKICFTSQFVRTARTDTAGTPNIAKRLRDQNAIISASASVLVVPSSIATYAKIIATRIDASRVVHPTCQYIYRSSQNRC